MVALPDLRPMEPCVDCGAVHERNGKPTCTGHRSSDGHYCTRWPLNGTWVCIKHGAAAPQVRARAALRLQEQAALQACDRLGIQVEVDPGDALIRSVWEAAGNVEFYRQLVAELPIHPEDDQRIVEDEDVRYERGEAGIYGRTYHQSGIPTGEAKPHILVVLYNQERDRLVDYTKIALAAGVEERRVRMAEADARTMFAAVGKALDAAELTPAQIEVIRSVLAQSLREPALDAGGSPGPTGEPIPA